MGEMQTKVVDAIRTAAKEVGLDCVVNMNYANTGNIVFQRGFDTVLSCSFDFQPSYASLQFYPPGAKPIMTIGFTDKNCLLSTDLKYEDMGESVRKMLDFIKSKGQAAA